MSDAVKIPFSQSMGGKAAAVAVALASSLFLALFLIATLPDKNSGWEKALPTPGMSTTDAEAALLRARYLHESAIRPQLIKAGFFSPGDVNEWRGPHSEYHANELSSRMLTDALWTFRAFPALHDAFLADLLNEKTSPEERLRDFYLYGGFLAAIADTIRSGLGSRYHAYDKVSEWFAYFVDDPRLRTEFPPHGNPRYRFPKIAARTARLFEERLAFARAILPKIFADLKKDITARTALAAEKKNKTVKSPGGVWEGYDDKKSYLENLNSEMALAVKTLWEKRADPGFAALVEEIAAFDEGSLRERYELIHLAAKRPRLPFSEFLFWREYKSDLASITSCVDSEPAYYSHPLGRMGGLMAGTANQLKSRRTVTLSGHSGPGVTMTRTDAFTPEKNLSGKLYLLVDSDLHIKYWRMPEYDLSRAYPIFQGMLHRHMERQPLVLPLNPSIPKDAALIGWYAQTGWKEDHALLFSAVGSPGDVARHWGLLRLLWWENNMEKGGEPSLAYLYPESGHFMAGMLPALKGEAVARFLGPVTALWFGVRSVDETGWVDEKYEARPETPPVVQPPATVRLRSPVLDWFAGEEPETAVQASSYSETTATILIDGDVRSALNKSLSRNNRIRHALNLDKEYHDPAASPQAVFDFVATNLDELDKWGFKREENLSAALAYLWRFRNDADADSRIRNVLSQKGLSPDNRLRKLRQFPDLMEKEGN